MTKSRRQDLSEEFTEQWQRCRDWLLPFMQNNQPVQSFFRPSWVCH
jgi:hypothetical protein